MEGQTDRCVNHVPAEERVTADEALVISGWLEGMTANQRYVNHVRAVGWYKAKELAKELQTTKQ